MYTFIKDQKQRKKKKKGHVLLDVLRTEVGRSIKCRRTTQLVIETSDWNIIETAKQNPHSVTKFSSKNHKIILVLNARCC